MPRYRTLNSDLIIQTLEKLEQRIADRFPGRERREKIPFPNEILKERFPTDDDSKNGTAASDSGALREERRLF